MGKRNNVIEIKGIVRNTKDSGTRDGESDELVGMRMKDESWRPVGALRLLEGSNGLVNGLRRVWVHRNRYAHILAIDAGGRLVWAGNILNEDENENHGKVVAFSDVTVIDGSVVSAVSEVVVTQTGHLIAVKTAEYGMRYYMFRVEANEYDSVAVDFNTVRDYGLLPYGTVDFKVERVEDEEGRAVWFSTDIQSAGIASVYGTVAKEGEVVKTVVDKTKGDVKRLGMFTDAFLVCTAAELYDGTYILMSKPALMCPSSYSSREAMGSWNTELRANPTAAGGVSDGRGNLVWTGVSGVCDKLVCKYQVSIPTVMNDIRMGKMMVTPWMYGGRTYQPAWGSFYDYFSDARNGMKKYNFSAEKVKDSNFSAYSFDTWSLLSSYDINGKIESTHANGHQLSIAAMNLRPMCQMQCYADVKDDNTSCFVNANKLYYKINNLLSKEYRDVIRNISVFVTREVDMLDYYSAPVSDSYFETVGRQPDGSNSFHRIAGYQWNYRDFDNIVKELMGEALMYKIGEISVDLSEADMGKWVALEIEDGVLENLVSQERLRVDSVGRNVYLPRVAFPYNGQLHLANYDERLFEGWLMKDFFHWGGVGQYGYTTKTLTSWNNGVVNGWVKVTLEDSEARRTVVRQITLPKKQGGIVIGRKMSGGASGSMVVPKFGTVDASVQSLGPILSYPDKRAKEIEIYLRDPGVAAGQNNVFHLKVALEAHDWYNMAYWVNTDFKPVEITYTEVFAGTIALPEEENVSETWPNKMKVSRVDNPLFFPDDYVYQIGNGEIRALAANAETLAAGQIGDAPLYVMCSDGVWGLFVDSSGQFAYTNSRIVSRYVCNNAHGAKAIHGGVVMPTEWGMVMLNGLSSEDVSDVVEGPAFDVATRLPSAWTCIGHHRLVELRSLVGGEFISFLRTAIVGFNFYRKELWVMGSGYSYVLGEKGGWTKRKETGVQLVEDFPNLYLLDSAGRLYDLQREDETEATECMVITRMVKADTQEFKQTERMIVRGEFKVPGRSEVARLVDLTGCEAVGNLQEVSVENPAITTLTEKVSIAQRIDGEVKYEVYASGQWQAYKSEWAIVERASEFGLSGSGALLPWGETETTFGNALKAKAEMWDGTVLRTEWTALTGAADDYPMFRFDNDGKPHVKFGNGTAYKMTLNDEHHPFYTPEGWEGKYARLIEIVSDHNNGDSKVLCRYPSGETIYGASTLYEYDWGNSGATNQDVISMGIAANNNAKIHLISGATEKNIQVVNGWTSAAIGSYSAYCHNVATAMRNKTGSWSEVKKNNRVTLTEGNAKSMDGLSFSVTAAQAGTYFYYQIEANVASGTFGKALSGFGRYTLEDGKCYRLGANGDAFMVMRGGTFTWADMQLKVASGEWRKIEAASGSDTVALVAGECYRLRFKNVVASENIDVKVRSLFTNNMTIQYIESQLSNPQIFETITGDMVDVGTRRSLRLTKDEIVRARWKTGNTIVEKVVKVPFTANAQISQWILNFIEEEPYEPSSEDCPVVGMYLFGSYDGYKWKMLGARERSGEFRDLGLEAHRVDCKYFRLVVCGKMLSGSSIEYIEQEVKERLYEGKIR